MACWHAQSFISNSVGLSCAGRGRVESADYVLLCCLCVPGWNYLPFPPGHPQKAGAGQEQVATMPTNTTRTTHAHDNMTHTHTTMSAVHPPDTVPRKCRRCKPQKCMQQNHKRFFFGYTPNIAHLRLRRRRERLRYGPAASQHAMTGK